MSFANLSLLCRTVKDKQSDLVLTRHEDRYPRSNLAKIRKRSWRLSSIQNVVCVKNERINLQSDIHS